MRAIPVLTVLLALALPLSATAEHCTGPSARSPELDTCVAGLDPCFYVDHDPCQPSCGPSIWVYEESNGIPGLQRGDEVYDDTCHGMIESDTIFF